MITPGLAPILLMCPDSLEQERLAIEAMVDDNEHLEAALRTARLFGFENGIAVFNALIIDRDVKGYRTESVSALYDDWRLLTRAYIERHFEGYIDQWRMAL